MSDPQTSSTPPRPADPASLVAGDAEALVERATRARRKQASYVQLADAVHHSLRNVDWQGASADAAQRTHRALATKLQSLSDAAGAVAEALEDQHTSLVTARGKATQAAEQGAAATRASQAYRTRYNQQVAQYRAWRAAYERAIAAGSPPPPPVRAPGEFVDPAANAIQEARARITDIRKAHAESSASTEARVRRATQDLEAANPPGTGPAGTTPEREGSLGAGVSDTGPIMPAPDLSATPEPDRGAMTQLLQEINDAPQEWIDVPPALGKWIDERTIELP